MFLMGESGSPAVVEDELVKTATAVIRERVDHYNHRFGIVLGIIDAKGSRVIAYGRAKEGMEVDGDSTFNLGSVAKLFTATLLADMVERGEVKLDDKIEKFLPPNRVGPEPESPADRLRGCHAPAWDRGGADPRK